jgi:metallo-beta-lactamase family protein
MVKVTCLGGVESVTGSTFLVQGPKGKKILVDCGLFQGGRQIEMRNSQAWGFDPKEISHLFLSHAHIDHSGRIPKLVKDGFRGKIITTPPTADLCQIMLLDSAHVQEMDAQWQTRKNKRQSKKTIEPLYTTKDAEESLKYFYPTERKQIITVEPGMRACFRDAGHVLGSSFLELWIEDAGKEIKIVFSGDLGQKDQLIVNNADIVTDADYLFVESTYGDRLHRSFEESKDELFEAIQYALSHGQKVIIPAFALERTQEILYILGEFYRNGKLPDIPVYLDSPLAIKATEIFRKNKKYYDEGARAIVDQGFDPFNMPNLRFTPTTEESIAINSASGPAIVIAGSGMCNAGRIKHHLKHNLWRDGASIVFVGFQAKGSLGRKIVDGERRVKVLREDVTVKAKVFTIGGFSAHADQNDLMEWVGNFRTSRPKIFVVHGETKASETLANLIQEKFRLSARIPKWKETLTFVPREKVFLEAPPIETYQIMQDAIYDMENEIAALRSRLEKKTEISEAELDKIRTLKKQMKEIVAD